MNRKTESEYRRYRKRAAEFNEKLRTLESASEVLGVSKDSLLNYELGLCKQVPVDVVCRMADIYHAPELLNYFCCSECPIGKLTVNPIDTTNIENIYKLSINVTNILGEGNKMRNRLLEIVADGVIDEAEKEDVNHILENLKKLSALTNELGIYLEKAL